MLNKMLNKSEREIVDKLLFDSRNLFQEKEYEFKEIEFVLFNKKEPEKSIIGICDKNWELYEVILGTKEINTCQDWAWNFDDDIFERIEDEYDIAYMNYGVHSGIWSDIEEIGIEEYSYQLGLQKYLKYCKENNIDKKTIDEKVETNVPDIMKYYNEKTNYISIKDGKVELPKEIYLNEKDRNYIIFCLGYDFLNVLLKNSETKECDISYEFCEKMADKFLKSEYYKNMRKSTYDNLTEWIEDNSDMIRSSYFCHIGMDNKAIMEIGERNGQPVALVEQSFKDGTKEYIVAFNYELKDRKLDWGYGYYYMQNIEKAKEDFEKVKAGGNLSDTFKNDNTEQKIKKHKYKER